MERRTTFADIQSAGRKRAAKRDLFLREMDAAIPWDALEEIVKPRCYAGKRGRRPVGIQRMLRMHFLQLWFNLSDEGVEDATCDSRAFSEFMGVTFGAGDQVPDATTLLKFRRIIESKGLAPQILACVDSMLEAKGAMMRGGSIVDATFIEAPSSTKNAEKSRDPGAHSSKKGNVWHFGHKARAGAGAGSGLARTVEATAANVHDAAKAAELVREDDAFCHGDSGCLGVEKRGEAASDEHLSSMERKIAKRPSQVKEIREEDDWQRGIESREASVRSKVEHPFLVVKRRFGFAKTRYGGLRKTANALTVLFAVFHKSNF